MGLAVIVALVVANMILIPLAIRHAQGSGDRGTRQVPQTSPRQEGSQSSTGRSPEARSGHQPSERDPLLMSSGGRIILTSTHGSCTDRTQPSVRLSTDQGQTFRTLK